ncbi:MAG: hypothetical protein AAF961_14940, partial [Planctomycetota bacterium]
QPSSGLRPKSERAIWGVILLAWFVALCVVPDPRPLGAPEWSVGAMQSLLGLSEPAARAVATITLRGIGLGLLSVLTALFLSSAPLKWAAPIALITAITLGVASQWINYGYFPIAMQIQLGVVSASFGTLIGLAMRRSRIALIALIVFGVGLFAWGSSTGITDELDVAARTTGLHVLNRSNKVPDGDDGFASLLRLAFTFAEDNSHGTDAVLPNKAAIVALGVILGEERVAEVAGRPIDREYLADFATLRNRITLRGRNDLARHFWVSAALAILSDQSLSMTVGIGKELMDATPGGSGFSFVDLTADRAGVLFAGAATSSPEAARAMQTRIRQGLTSADLCPEIDDLPEGLSRDEFQTEYGGLGGAKTGELVEEIEKRLTGSEGLWPQR